MTGGTRGPRALELRETAVVDDVYAATARLLQRQPFNDVSVAHILIEANVSRATFYVYFASKFAVLGGLLEQAMDDIFETVQPFLARAPQDSPYEALERSIGAVTRAWHRHRSVLQEVSHHWHSEPGLRELWLEIVERFVAAGAIEIDRERAAGLVVSDLPSRTLAAALFWSTERVLYVAGMGIDPDIVDEHAAFEPLVALWRGILYGR